MKRMNASLRGSSHFITFSVSVTLHWLVPFHSLFITSIHYIHGTPFIPLGPSVHSVSPTSIAFSCFNVHPSLCLPFISLAFGNFNSFHFRSIHLHYLHIAQFMFKVRDIITVFYEIETYYYNSKYIIG